MTTKRWADKVRYYWNYHRNSRRFPEIRGMTHKTYLSTFVHDDHPPVS